MIKNARNTSIHATTKTTPYEIFYVRPPPANDNNPIDTKSEYAQELVKIRKTIESHAKSNMERQLRKQHNYYNSKRIKLSNIEVGDQVLIIDESIHAGESKKLGQKYRGPYVVESVSPHNLTIDFNGQTKAIHRSRAEIFPREGKGVRNSITTPTTNSTTTITTSPPTSTQPTSTTNASKIYESLRSNRKPAPFIFFVCKSNSFIIVTIYFIFVSILRFIIRSVYVVSFYLLLLFKEGCRPVFV